MIGKVGLACENSPSSAHTHKSSLLVVKISPDSQTVNANREDSDQLAREYEAGMSSCSHRVTDQ